MILPLNTLIVEDHPFVLEVYKNSCLTYAQHHPDKVKFNIKTAASSEEALRHAGNFLADQKLDLAMLDLRIPASEDGSIQSGLDLGIYLKKTL
jgi:DNA-binding NarL/FixJ family response regulator